MFRALTLGADTVNSARGFMFSLGCIQSLKCHANTCPTGIATQEKDDTVPVEKIADRYKALAELGEKVGILPMAEMWGFSKTLKTLNETVKAALLSGHSKACVLPDVYHLYKGGSDFDGLKLLGARGIGIFHVNDYPKLDRGKIVDADRVYPGDGIAPLADIVASLKEMNYLGYLSLELFNSTYWKQDPLEVARTGLKKLKAI